MRLPGVLVLVCVLAPLPANAGTLAAQAALAVTDGFIIPHYLALSQAARAQLKAWHTLCATQMRGRETELRAAYHTLADRWAEIEFIKTGPISLSLRAERFNYWPELRNATSAGLTALLASNDPKALSPETLVRDSIPAQGLPALERLLYDDAYTANPRRCEVGEGIARNLAAIAHDVVSEWTAANGVRAAIAANRAWNNNRFANATEAANMLLGDLVGAFTAIDDLKLLAPMGPTLAATKPRAAEAWRSGRSGRNIRLNLAAAHAIEQLLAASVHAQAKQSLAQAFVAAEQAAKSVPDDIGAAAGDPKRRSLLEFANVSFRSAQSLVVNILAPALGVTLGFNALDGD